METFAEVLYPPGSFSSRKPQESDKYRSLLPFLLAHSVLTPCPNRPIKMRLSTSFTYQPPFRTANTQILRGCMHLSTNIQSSCRMPPCRRPSASVRLRPTAWNFSQRQPGSHVQSARPRRLGIIMQFVQPRSLGRYPMCLTEEKVGIVPSRVNMSAHMLTIHPPLLKPAPTLHRTHSH